MVADLDGRVPPPAPPPDTAPISGLPIAPHRPARPARGPGRWFRACVGIEEDIMDWAPSERAKYTGLGIIVLNTGFLATLAMLTALNKIVSASTFALLPFALAWGWVIFSVDRWLITSTHGVRGASRVFIFLPRLVLAILLAFTIAEPLTLRIFQNTLDSKIEASRTAQLDKYESQLLACNPASGQWIGSAACANHHIGVSNSLTAILNALATTQGQWNQLQATLVPLWRNYQNLISAGDLAEANAYARQNRLFPQERLQKSRQKSITRLALQARAAQITYAPERHAAILAKVNIERKDLDQQIGIIDEWRALERLSSQSTFVAVGHWLLVLILIALDSLPILAKLMSGSSVYDQVLAGQKMSDARIYQTDLRSREQTATVDKEVEIYLAETSKRDRMRTLDQQERVRKAQGGTDGLDDVRRLAAQWLREAQEEGVL
jgi:hypothetical protein